MFGVRLEVWGPYALFTRPECKVERCSYDVITPCAARGILEAIYWKPAIRWQVDRLHVLNPIRFTNIRRNEVSAKLSGANALAAINGSAKELYLNTSAAIQQRASLVLTNVHYVIEGHFSLTKQAGPTDTPEKHHAISLRRMRQGQQFYQPYFGCKEFPAHYRLLEEGQPLPPSKAEQQTRDLGLMLYDLDYRNPQQIKPLFFHAVLEDGILDLTDCEVIG